LNSLERNNEYFYGVKIFAMKKPFLEESNPQDTLQHSKLDSNASKHIVNTTTINFQKKNTPKHQTIAAEVDLVKKDSLSKPEFSTIEFNNNSLIDNYKTYKWLNNNIDSNCYIVNKQIVTPKKILHISESTVATKKISSDYTVRQKIDTSYDWVFIPSIIGLVFLASIATFYRKYFGLLFESIFYRYSNNKILNEKNSNYQRLTFILDILYVISFSLAIDQIVKGLGVFSPPSSMKYIIFLVFVGLLIVLKLFRVLIFKLSAIFSNHKVFLKELLNSSSLYTRTLGIILVPLAFIMAYSSPTLNIVCVYTTIVLIIIMLILRTISMIRSFILGGISIFYFILYLCALEIVPLLIIIKEVKSR
jgi:hypothetical protein